MRAKRKMLWTIGATLSIFLVCSLITPAKAKPPHGSTIPQVPEATKSRIQAAFLRAPLQFEPNRGQSDERVKYLARSKGFQLFLTPTEAVMVLREHEPKTRDPGQAGPSVTRNPKSKTDSPKSSVVRMKLVGAMVVVPLLLFIVQPKFVSRVRYIVAGKVV